MRSEFWEHFGGDRLKLSEPELHRKYTYPEFIPLLSPLYMAPVGVSQKYQLLSNNVGKACVCPGLTELVTFQLSPQVCAQSQAGERGVPLPEAVCHLCLLRVLPRVGVQRKETFPMVLVGA